MLFCPAILYTGMASDTCFFPRNNGKSVIIRLKMLMVEIEKLTIRTYIRVCAAFVRIVALLYDGRRCGVTEIYTRATMMTRE